MLQIGWKAIDFKLQCSDNPNDIETYQYKFVLLFIFDMTV